MGSKFVYRLEYVTTGGGNETATSVPMTRAKAQQCANELVAMGYNATVHALEPDKVDTRSKKRKSGAKVIPGSLHLDED